jgi:hypothetical protein
MKNVIESAMAMMNRVAERDMAQRIGANQSLFVVLRIAAPAFIGVLRRRLRDGRIIGNNRGPALSGQ